LVAAVAGARDMKERIVPEQAGKNVIRLHATPPSLRGASATMQSSSRFVAAELL